VTVLSANKKPSCR